MISFEMTNGANDLEVRSFGSAQVRYVLNVFRSMQKVRVLSQNTRSSHHLLPWTCVWYPSRLCYQCLNFAIATTIATDTAADTTAATTATRTTAIRLLLMLTNTKKQYHRQTLYHDFLPCILYIYTLLYVIYVYGIGCRQMWEWVFRNHWQCSAVFFWFLSAPLLEHVYFREQLKMNPSQFNSELPSFWSGWIRDLVTRTDGDLCAICWGWTFWNDSTVMMRGIPELSQSCWKRFAQKGWLWWDVQLRWLALRRFHKMIGLDS